MAFKICCFDVDLRTVCIVIAMHKMLGGVMFLSTTSFISPTNDPIIVGAYGGIGAGIFFLYGATKNNRTAIIIHLVFMGIAIVIFTVLAIILFMMMDQMEIKEETDGIMSSTGKMWTFFAFILLIAIYLWLCIYHFLQELKAGTYSPIN